MFAICVFRRFGLAVPITFFVVGLILEILVDRKRGGGYYTNHLWTIGLNVLVTGILTGILACVVNPPPTSSGYSSLRDLDLEDMNQMFKTVSSTFLWMTRKRTCSVTFH